MTTATSNQADPLAAALTPWGGGSCCALGRNGMALGRERTVAQIHALLFLLGRPMNAGDGRHPASRAFQREQQPARAPELELVRLCIWWPTAATTMKPRTIPGTCCAR
jgi:hypothetical protein